MRTDTRSLLYLGSELTSYDIQMILVEKEKEPKNYRIALHMTTKRTLSSRTWLFWWWWLSVAEMSVPLGHTLFVNEVVSFFFEAN